MSSINKAIIVLMVALLGMGGLLFWKTKFGNKKVVLTKADMTLLAEAQSPQERSALASDPEQRKEFAKFVKRILAIGAAAEHDGLGNELELKQELDLQRTATLAQAYLKSKQKADPQASLFNDVKPEEVEAYYQIKANQTRFDKFVAQLKEKNPQVATQLTDERLKDLRQRYGQTFLAADKAIAAGMDKDRATELQLQFQRARVLTQKFAEKNIVEEAKKLANDKAVDEYIAKHPELDENKMKEKAQGILQRIKNGEDFNKLADEFTEDPSGKGKGGDLGWFGKGQMVPEFDKAAFSMQPGQVSEIIKTDFGFHIIKLEEKRVTGGDKGKDAKAEGKDEVKKAHADDKGKQPKPKTDAPEDMEMNPGQPPMPAKPAGPQEEVHARHILVKVGGDKQQMGGPPQAPREQAKAAVEEEKQKEIVEDIVKNSHVEVPEEFEVAPLEGGDFPPGMGGPQGPPPQQPQGPPPGGKPKAVAPAQPKKK